jgi:hypothetical protein
MSFEWFILAECFLVGRFRGSGRDSVAPWNVERDHDQ